jgi:multiple sugar transport system substrate-binding protein
MRNLSKERTMQHTTRRLFLGGAGALGATTLAACGGGSGGGGGDIPDEIPADEAAEIAYSIWDPAQKPAMEKIIAAFNEEYPDITVSISVTPFAQYFEKLQTQATGGDLPDVFWMNGPNFQLYASEGKLQDVSEVPGVDTAKYPQAMNDLYTLDDAQFAVPKDFDTIALWWNQDLFEQAGVEAPDGNWTWGDYAQAARQITDALGEDGIWGGCNGVENQAYLYPMTFQAGGEIVSDDGTTSGYDSPGAIEAFTFARSLVEDGAHPSIAYLTDNKPADVFNGGKAAMYWSGNWSAAVFKDSPVKDAIRTAPLPQGAETANVIHGIGNAMAAEGANKAAAAAFLAFLGSEQANLIQAEEGAANPAHEGTATAYVESVPEFDLQMFIDNAADARPYPVSKNTNAWLSLEADYFPRILGGELEVEAGLGELAEKMNQALADEQ